ncbi:hypothetical protein [Nocardioides nanhaiensis]|uniref:Uncharacterized protein n=1 Tax=Nocardioides nanhaiensis TaxID=1476871 RepID=A0ABP8WEJ9_9ACTN
MTPTARAWVAHLTAGGTTPWAQWRAAADHATADTGGEPDPGGTARHLRYLPGAQQLELLRRLNEAGRPGPALAERVLATSAPGRGIADLELVGAARDTPFGPRPVDPADLPDAELVRVATGLLAEDVVAGGPAAPEPGRRAWPWRRRYRLVGDPWLADPARAELVRRRRPPGGQQPTVHVVGADLASMLEHVWSARALVGAAPAWRDWLDPLVRRRRVPPRIDLPAVAGAWATRVGPVRVRVVLDPALLPGLLGTRAPLPGPLPLSADALELSRRVGAALGLLVLPEQRTRLLQQAWAPALADLPAARGTGVAVPQRRLARLTEVATRMREELCRADYPVLGDPDLLLPAATRRSDVEPTDAGVLALALAMVLGPTPGASPGSSAGPSPGNGPAPDEEER